MATVDRVLPWRRHAPIPADEIAPVVDAYRQRHPKAPIGTIVRAYEVAAEAHQHQYRKSGEKYINHPISVAKVVADIGLDDTTVAAALLTTPSRTQRSRRPRSRSASAPRSPRSSTE